MGFSIENQEDIAGLVHEWLAYLLIVLATLHALAALKHHVIDKDDTLNRMIGKSLKTENTNEKKQLTKLALTSLLGATFFYYQ